MLMLEKMKFGQESSTADTEEEDRKFFANPKRALNDLKSLYDQNKIEFSKSDQTRVLTALYTQEKPVVRLYRELLYQRIA